MVKDKKSALLLVAVLFLSLDGPIASAVDLTTVSSENFDQSRQTEIAQIKVDAPALTHEDPRFTIRTYPLGKIRSISISDRTYRTAEGKFCRKATKDDNLTRQHTRFFLKHAEAVSDGSMASYYHEWGTCYSSDVIVKFKDGRQIAISYSDEGATAYISPLVNGKKGEAFPHICRPCGGETFN